MDGKTATEIIRSAKGDGVKGDVKLRLLDKAGMSDHLSFN